jgi:ABC-2 type transport system permease protein
MTLFLQELKRGRKVLLIWSLLVAFFVAVCILVYPEMKNMKADFSNMGAFSSAFGLNQFNFLTFFGFYGVECGMMMTLGGSLYAAFIGINIISKEEYEKTADFLLTQPYSRGKVAFIKFIAMQIQVILFNLLMLIAAIICMIIIKQDFLVREFYLIHMAVVFINMVIASISYSLSCFLRQNGTGIGLGLAVLLYFVYLVGNISNHKELFSKLSPFSLSDTADILTKHVLNGTVIIIWTVVSIVMICIGLIKYVRKDIY